MNAGVLALDLATVTGWAFWKPGMADPMHDTLRLPKTPKGMSHTPAAVPTGRFLTTYRDWLEDMITIHDPETVIFEAPFVGEDTHQDTAEKLLGLASVTRVVCWDEKVPCIPSNMSKVRTHFVRGAFLKSDVVKRLTIEECVRRGWEPDDDNAADALAILDWAAYDMRLPVPWNCSPKPKAPKATFASEAHAKMAVGAR